MKILLVEDDELSGLVLSEALTTQHYIVNLATDGQTGLALAEAYEYDLILLDVLIPKLDGISLCRKLRSQGYQKPILLLTGNTSNQDRVDGLDAGADDYVSKPYELNELMARIRALLRRGHESIAPNLSWGDLRLNPTSGEVTFREKVLSLTRKEYSLLELFLRNPQRIFSRSDILDRLWSLTDAPTESAVTAHIKDLRHKLRAAGVAADLIETIYGFGYRLKALPDKKEKIAAAEAQQGPKSTQTTAAAPANTAQKLRLSSDLTPVKTIPDTAQRAKHLRQILIAQVAILEQAATALLDTNALDSTLQQQARQEAHKLAGSLGMFGYHEGSTLARQVESLLQTKTPLKAATGAKLLQLLEPIQQEIKQSLFFLQGPSIEVEQEHKHRDFDRATKTSDSPLQSSTSGLVKVLVIDDDVMLSEALQIEAIAWKMQMTVISDITIAKAVIADMSPNAILLNLDLPGASEDGLTLLTELATQYADIPVFVITDRDDLNDRVKISRLGGQGFFRKPVLVEQVLAAIAQSRPPSLQEARVLIVDDDPIALATFSSLLQPWGIQVTTLEQPQHFWEVLTAVVPDALVLDVEMPDFNGIDLCRVVRYDALWGDLPILVVTAHTNMEAVKQVFAAGADDFIQKPVIGPEFVSRVLSRLERIQLQRRLKAPKRLTHSRKHHN